METRRSFLKTVLAGTAVVAGARLGLGEAEAGWFGGGQEDEWVRVGKLLDFPDGGRQAVQQGVRQTDNKPMKGLKLVVSRRGEQVHVMSAKCTHLGCEVVLQADGSFLCPCHDARFDAQGAATKGPAKKPLPWLEAKVENGDVLANIGKEIPAP